MQERDQRRLTRIIKRDRRAALPQIAVDFNAGPSTSVYLRTIQRNIIDMGFQSRRSTHVPLLTARHKTLRLACTSQHRHWTVDDWKHFAWSDESRYQLNRAEGHVRVCWQDQGPLICLDTTLTGDRYVSILSDHLHPLTSIVHSDGLREFQQDNRHLICLELLQNGSRSTLRNLDTSSGHQKPQT
ncbi:HTH_Tnp_Tc3_2 domain-containing protein [Trichonephila clavipes]|nr:HTH_Tnp_Tc3_2 domain-containing protein [Trichonephila clavipes]